MSEPETMMINKVEYVRKDYVQTETVVWGGEKSIANRMIGKAVIVRSRNEGVNAGIVVIADETGVELKNCRRLYYHKPKDSSVAWYEGVSVSGLHADSKVSGTVKQKVIIEDYSMTYCHDSAYKSIMEHPNVKS